MNRLTTGEVLGAFQALGMAPAFGYYQGSPNGGGIIAMCGVSAVEFHRYGVTLAGRALYTRGNFDSDYLGGFMSGWDGYRTYAHAKLTTMQRLRAWWAGEAPALPPVITVGTMRDKGARDGVRARLVVERWHAERMRSAPLRPRIEIVHGVKLKRAA